MTRLTETFVVREAAAAGPAGTYKRRLEQIIARLASDVSRAPTGAVAASAVNKARAEIDVLLGQWAQEALR